MAESTMVFLLLGSFILCLLCLLSEYLVPLQPT
jgi:hypothetical protein